MVERDKNMTVIVDASVDAVIGAAGWCGFARKDGWAAGIFQGQPFQTLIHDSTDSEICGIANWLEKLTRENHMHDVQRIILQSDSLMALQIILSECHNTTVANARKHRTHIIMPNKSVRTLLQERAVGLIKNIIPLNVTIWLKHVKGHQGMNKSARHTVNEICDQHAKIYMRQRRQQIEANRNLRT